MEPISIGLGAIAAAIIGKVAEKAIERTAEEAVDAGGGAAGRLVGWLRSKLSSSKELDLVEQVPDSARAQAALAEVIDAEIVDESDVAQLRELLGQVKQDQPGVYQTAIGNQNIQAAGGSTVTVNSPTPAPPTR